MDVEPHREMDDKNLLRIDFKTILIVKSSTAQLKA